MTEERLFYARISTDLLALTPDELVGGWNTLDEDEAIVRVVGRRNDPESDFKPVSVDIL